LNMRTKEEQLSAIHRSIDEGNVPAGTIEALDKLCDKSINEFWANKEAEAERLYFIGKTQKECAWPEGTDLRTPLEQGIQEYWRKREADIRKQRHDQFIARWGNNPFYKVYKSVVKYFSRNQ